MDNLFLKSLENTLNKSTLLLNSITEQVYVDNKKAPFFTSIGSHIRHILDFYKCIFNGLSENCIDLSVREREISIENNISIAKLEINDILQKIDNIKIYNLEKSILLIDDLGSGKISVPTNIYGILVQANSHTIHHYAIISHLLYSLNIQIPDKTFGYNPTTKIKFTR
jgi:hypothetical protein